MCYTKILEGEIGTKACGLDDVFSRGSLWMLGASCVVCNNILFAHSFKT